MSIWILAKVGENERLNKIKEVGIFSKSEILNFYSPLENGKKVGIIPSLLAQCSIIEIAFQLWNYEEFLS